MALSLKVPRLWRLLFPAVISFLLISNEGHAASTNELINIGAIIDDSTRIGKEEKVAIQLAAEKFNGKLTLHFMDSEGDPFLAASAEKLIREKEVEVIVGTKTWQEAVVVADIGNKSQIPILSLAAPALGLPLVQSRWPFLIRMASNASAEIKCIAELVNSYGWRRVTAIYETDVYGSDNGMLTPLSDALQNTGSQIEYHLALPPYSSLSDPKGFVQKELEKLLRKQSRVFVVLSSSLPMATHLFQEAKSLGLLEAESAWIVGGAIADLLDAVNTSVISSMEGALGIRTYYPEEGNSYHEFSLQFRKLFRTAYPEEDSYEAGIHALRAYDCITAVAEAVENMVESITGDKLLTNIQSSNFTGLTGEIHFRENELSHKPVIRIVNVVGKRYKELDFWTPVLGFSKSLVKEEGKEEVDGDVITAERFSGNVYWPGDIQRAPKGWALSGGRSLKIAVPVMQAFEGFVSMTYTEKPGERTYDGFCIELFHDVLEKLDYSFLYEFEPYYGEYDDLIHLVGNKTYDAVVGDMTILYNRSKEVEFTQPYAESGLSMIVQGKPESSAWMFMKPFTWQMWLSTGGILIYTMFVVWFLEHQSNPEFRGPWKSQISTTVWFTFSSLFFAHRENIHSNLSKLVLIVWLFLVFVVTSSYTASLSSMLTVQQMKPATYSNTWKVACDNNSFVKKYLVDVLKFPPDNIIEALNENDYREKFERKEIAAAFLELPYEKVFLNKHCEGYVSTRSTFRFGGLGFAFQKGSPLARDFSDAILKLSESGHIRHLETKWLTPSEKCSMNATSIDSASLKIDSFWGLFVMSAATSTICLIICITRLYKGQDADRPTARRFNDLTQKTVGLAKYFYSGQANSSARSASFVNSPSLRRRRSSSTSLSTSEISPNGSFSPATIEITSE